MPLSALALDAQIEPEESALKVEQKPIQEEATLQVQAPVVVEEVPPETPSQQQVEVPTLRIDEPEPETPTPPVSVLPSLIINRVVAGIPSQSSYEYIELYNPNPDDVTLDSWEVLLSRKDDSDAKQSFVLTGVVKAHSYVLLAGTDTDLDNYEPDFRLKASSIVTTGGIVELIDDTGDVIEQLRWGDTADPSHSLATNTALERVYIDDMPSLEGDNLEDFTVESLELLPRSGGYEPYEEPITRCMGVRISEIAANVEDDVQFVELYNDTTSAAPLDGCLLQTNRSTTKSHVLTGTLAVGEYGTVAISTSGLVLTKTTSGTVYLLSSDGSEELDERSYDNLASQTSWSWFGGNDWRQTFARTPGGANIWQEFLPCESGYERNAETGRCRKVEVVEEDSVAACPAGQYRHPETNRCRNNATTASTLTPCRADQERNPETNRCRTIASAASTLAPCRAGQERNPETNRCRAVNNTDVPKAAFAVEPVAEAGKSFVGWWALGGVGILAAGYGIWEWRRELWGGLQKIGTFFTSGK